MPATRKTVKAKIDKRLISEVTRFFGGWDTMLQELVQNVYRSQAKRLDITFNEEECLLEFVDDGVGCADPQTLLSAGKTGWDEGEIKAPAGLGFFSLFDPSIVSNVIVSSHRWKLIIPPELAVSHTFEVQRLPRKQPGFKVQLCLQPEFVAKETNSTWSSLNIVKLTATLQRTLTTYPFKMYLNGKQIINDDAKALTYAVELHSAKWGTVYLNYGSTSDRSAVIWEHRMTESSTFKKALKNAAQSDPLFRWIAGESLNGYTPPAPRLVWRINTHCGVQPKLPDREDLIDNGHLNRAAKAWLEIIAAWYDNGVHKEWPDVIRNTDVLETKVASNGLPSKAKTETLARNTAIEPILLRHQWRPNDAEDLSNLEISIEDNSTRIRHHSFGPLWTKTGVPVLGHDYLVLRNIDPNLLSFGRIPTIATEEEEVAEIVLDWDPPFAVQQPAEDQHLYIAPARSITWCGHELPFYFLTEEEREEHHVAVIIAGTPEQVAEILEVSFRDYLTRDNEKQAIFDIVTKRLLSLADRGDLFGQYLYATGWEGDIADNGDGEPIKYPAMYGALRDEFYSHYFPYKVELNEDLNFLIELTSTIDEVGNKLVQLDHVSKHRPSGLHAEVLALITSFESYQEKITTTIDQVKDKLQKPAQQGVTRG